MSTVILSPKGVSRETVIVIGASIAPRVICGARTVSVQPSAVAVVVAIRTPSQPVSAAAIRSHSAPSPTRRQLRAWRTSASVRGSGKVGMRSTTFAATDSATC
jgi:hypothetical protein